MSASIVVSFVVPSYNYGRYLPECLASIFGQSYQPSFEVLVIDDGSTDNTREVLNGWSDPRLRVISHQVNQGHVATINEGLSQTRGQFIARIDPDDRYRPNFLKAVLDKFAAHPEVDLVYGDAALIDEQGQLTAEHSDRIHGGRDYTDNEYVNLLEENYICAPTLIARRWAWLKACPAPSDLAFNDWYFTLMMARHSQFYYLNEVLAEYRVHALNHHTKIARDKSEEDSIIRLLDRLFSEKETDPQLEAQKQRGKNRIYGKHYLTTADKYFWLDMNADARRCYLAAIRRRPELIWRIDVVRRLLATVLSRRAYDQMKLLLLSGRR